jgi:hypothetical protein
MSFVMEHYTKVQNREQEVMKQKDRHEEELQRILEERRKKNITKRHGTNAGSMAGAKGQTDDEAADTAAATPEKTTLDSSTDDVLVLIDPAATPEKTTLDSSTDDVLVLIDPVRDFPKKATEQTRTNFQKDPNNLSDEQVAGKDQGSETPIEIETQQIEEPVSRQQRLKDEDEEVTLMSSLQASLISSGSYRSCRESALLSSSPRTAALELFNIDLETWLERGSHKEIFECAQRLGGMRHSPPGKETTDRKAAEGSSNKIHSTLDSGAFYRPKPEFKGHSWDSESSGSRASTLPSSAKNGGNRFQASGQRMAARPQSSSAVRSSTRPWFSSWGDNMSTPERLGGMVHTPVDPVRVFDPKRRVNGYSPVVNRIMKRIDVETLHQEISKLQSENRQLAEERRVLVGRIEHQSSETMKEHNLILEQLEQSVHVGCILRAQLADAHEQLASVASAPPSLDSQLGCLEGQFETSLMNAHVMQQRSASAVAADFQEEKGQQDCLNCRKLEEKNAELSRALASCTALIQSYQQRSQGEPHGRK